MRVADWIAHYLHSIGVERIHGMMGGGAATLNDGFIKNPDLEYICYHHEQGAGHAAIGEAKYTGKLAVVNPTTGCGGTNCATSVLNAWQDGVPILFLSGNVKSTNCSNIINKGQGAHIRYHGAQEHDIISTMASMTKFSQFVTSAKQAQQALHSAVRIATTGRKGPVWIDIPSDVQAAHIGDLETFTTFGRKSRYFNISKLEWQLTKANRPIIIAGGGIRQSGSVAGFVRFIEKYRIPYVSTYGAKDLTAHDHPLNMGTVGLRGTRAANFALQNADLIVVLGSSLSATVIGYDPAQFNPKAYIIQVDMDEGEMSKEFIQINEQIRVPLEQFFEDM